MRMWLIVMLVVMSAVFFLLPFVPMNRDLVRAEIIKGGDYVVLRASEGMLKLHMGREVMNAHYSSSNVYDFFSGLIDPAGLQRLEILPYGNGYICNAVTVNGDAYAGDVKFCIALALRRNIPVYVHRDLLTNLSINNRGEFRNQ